MDVNVFLYGGIGNCLFHIAAGRYLRNRGFNVNFINKCEHAGTLEFIRKLEYVVDLPIDAPGYNKYAASLSRLEYEAGSTGRIGKFWFLKELHNYIKFDVSTIDAIGIHIRRGDFLEDRRRNKKPYYTDLCESTYYYNVAEICKNLELPIKIFTDDPKTIPDYILNLFPTAEITGNDPEKDFYEFASCRYKFLSESTFSLWCGYANSESTVFYPCECGIDDRVLSNWVPLAFEKSNQIHNYKLDIDVVVLTTHNSDRLNNGIVNYPSILPKYNVFYGHTPSELTVPMPSWYLSYKKGFNMHAKQATWCCLLGKLAILKKHLKEHPDKDLLFLEDDVHFPPLFNTYFNSFMAKVPHDWEIIWFGGSHVDSGAIEVAPGVLSTTCMSNSECILFRASVIPAVIAVLEPDYVKKAASHHSDLLIGSLYKTHKVYTPLVPFVGQNFGYSYIRSKHRCIGIRNKFMYTDINGNLVNASNKLLSAYL